MDPARYIQFADLGLSPVALALGPLVIRWYSLAYIAGILLGWAYLLRLCAQPGAPMARRHADDFVFYATIGILLGGRLGYVLFYNAGYYAAHPLDALKLWEGGMSFHGGAIGVTLAIALFCRRHALSLLRVADYVAVVVPIGLFFGRLANFVNGELWGRPATVPWAIVFPGGGPLPRHPSQLYEAALEGLALFAILSLAFWRGPTARYRPGCLTGLFLAGYGAFRFVVEFFREPDAQLAAFTAATHLHMGQWLCVPMMLAGLWLIATSAARRRRVEAIGGSASVA